MKIGYPDTKNRQGGGSPLFSKEDDKKKKPKIEAPNPQTGTTDFPTAESRESKVSPKDLGSMAVDVLTMAIPGGGILRGAKALSKVAKIAKSAKKHKQLHKLTNEAKKIKKVTKKDGYTSIDKGKAKYKLTALKKKPSHVTVDPKLKNMTSKEQLALHNRVNKGIAQIKPTKNQSSLITKKKK